MEPKDASPSKPPFTIRLLGNVEGVPTDEDLLSLLPASYLTKNDDIAPPRIDDPSCVERELDISRLQSVQKWLWVAGRPTPPRALHEQALRGRKVQVTERMDMHLVWTTGRIFLKPVPRFLLEPRFWEKRLLPRAHGQLHRTALGFLFSYAALVRHESDLALAQEARLLPGAVTWPGWRELVRQLDPEHVYPRVNGRFVYGELRLGRLNLVQRLSGRAVVRGHMTRWVDYHGFLGGYFALLASGTVFVAIVLTAMQVGQATSLADNGAFRSASYGFTLFLLLSSLVVAGGILLVFVVVIGCNWAYSVEYHKRRMKVTGGAGVQVLQ